MAFPTIPTGGQILTANIDGTGARTFPDLSGLTKSSGDLLIAIIVAYQSSSGQGAPGGTVFSAWGASFTEFCDQMTTNSSTMAIGAAYKWSTGSETGTFTVTQAATITGGASLILLSIPGAHDSTPPEAGTIADGTSAAADPGSFNPAGWGTEDTLWIAVAASGMTSGTSTWTATGTTAPANYGNRVDTNRADDSTIGRVEGAVAFRQLNAASEDVGTAGVDISNARNSALVIAVRPAAAAPIQVDPTAGALTLTGVAPTVAVTNNITVTTVAGSLTLTGVAPTVTAIGTFDGAPTAAALTITTATPAVATPILVQPTAGALTLAGATPDVEAIGTAESLPTAGALTLTTATPDVEAIGTALSEPTAAVLTLTTATPAVDAPSTFLPTAAALSLAGVAPTVEAIGTAESLPTGTALTLVGVAPQVQIGTTDSVQVNPTPGTLTLVGATPTVTAIGTANSQPTAAALTITRGTPTVVAIGTASSQPTAANLTLALQAPTVAVTTDTYAFPTPASMAITAMAPDVVVTENRLVEPTAAQLVMAMATPFVFAVAGEALPIHVHAAISAQSRPSVSVTPTGIYASLTRQGTITARVRGAAESNVSVED